MPHHTFDQFLAWLKKLPTASGNQCAEFETLGGRKTFHAYWSAETGGLEIPDRIVSPQRSKTLREIWDRWCSLHPNDQSSPRQFQGRTDQGYLNRISAPYTAAIIRDFLSGNRPDSTRFHQRHASKRQ